MDFQVILTCLQRALSDEDDRLLAHLSFVYEMKPAEIEAQYPGRWPNVRKKLFRIRQKLRTDSDFLDCIGFIDSAA